MLFASGVKRQESNLQKWLAPHADAYQISQLPVLGEFLFMQQLGFEKVRCNEMPMNSC
jgi:hypothetical protein